MDDQETQRGRVDQKCCEKYSFLKVENENRSPTFWMITSWWLFGGHLGGFDFGGPALSFFVVPNSLAHLAMYS